MIIPTLIAAVLDVNVTVVFPTPVFAFAVTTLYTLFCVATPAMIEPSPNVMLSPLYTIAILNPLDICL
jgi:hypothetical protein